MLYAFFWVIPRRLNFICRHFGTLSLFHLYRQIGMKDLHTYLPMKMEQSVPKRRHIKFRRRGITEKKAYNMSKDHSWDSIDTDKTEAFEEKAFPLPLSSPQVIRQMAWHRTRPSAVTGTKWTMARSQPSKMVSSFLTQHQYISSLAACFGLFKTIFRPMLTTGKYIPCVHRLWDPIKGKKVKCTLVQALRLCTGRTAHRGSRGIALL